MTTWFHGEFGFDEGDLLNSGGFAGVQERFSIEELDGEVYLESKENQRRFLVGKFEVPSLLSLRKRLKSARGEIGRAASEVPPQEPGEGEHAQLTLERRGRSDSVPTSFANRTGSSRELMLRQASGLDLNSGLTFSNISGNAQELHLEPTNADAVFQVASQFNCLEMVDPGEKPENGITQYCFDKTQGPACAMACPAATLFRNYFVPVDFFQEHGTKEWVGQAGGSARQLDTTVEVAELLDNRENKFWKMENGYLLPAPRKMREIAEKMTRGERVSVGEGGEGGLREAICGKMRVGVHWSTQTARFREGPPSRQPASPSRFPPRKMPGEGSGRGEGEDGAHRVCQVLCSAVPVAYDRNTREEEWEPFASAVLESQYEATLTVAAILAMQRKQRVKVFLTSVGGGAFQNRQEWILRAVDKALKGHREYPIDVKMVHYVMSPNHPYTALEHQYGPSGGAMGSSRRLSSVRSRFPGHR